MLWGCNNTGQHHIVYCFLLKPYIKEFCTVIYLISLTTGLITSPRTTSRYHPRNKSKEYIVSTKEALIGEHNLKPLLTGHKESIDW